MTEMYGHTWSSQAGDAPSDTWIRSLADLRPEQFARGMQRCLDRGETFPPTLPEFRAMCLGTDGGFIHAGESRCHRIYEPDRLLADETRQAENDRAARAALDAMKALWA